MGWEIGHSWRIDGLRDLAVRLYLDIQRGA